MALMPPLHQQQIGQKWTQKLPKLGKVAQSGRAGSRHRGQDFLFVRPRFQGPKICIKKHNFFSPHELPIPGKWSHHREKKWVCVCVCVSSFCASVLFYLCVISFRGTKKKRDARCFGGGPVATAEDFATLRSTRRLLFERRLSERHLFRRHLLNRPWRT